MADVLSSGPEPDRPARPRRWAGVAAAVAVAAVAALLAGRSGGDRPAAAPARTPSPTAAPEVDLAAPAVVSVAVGSRYAYALVADCTAQAIRACRYRLHRHTLGGTGWTPLPALRTEARGVATVLAEVDVTADDQVAVLLGPSNRRAITSPDDGASFTERELDEGPAVARVPETGLLISPPFSVQSRLTALDPGTGQLRPMAVQPPVGRARLRSYDLRGDVIWAVATGGEQILGAVSRDRGRSWRVLPVRGLAPATEFLQVVVQPDGGAYLLTGSAGDDGSARLSGIWQAAAGGSWRRLPAPNPRTLRSALAGERGLLLVDGGGALWRLRPGGSVSRLPDTTPERPGYLVTGSSRVLATVPAGPPGPVVLLSYDEGETWRTEEVV